MSLLSQLGPRIPGGTLTSVGISTAAAVELPQGELRRGSDDLGVGDPLLQHAVQLTRTLLTDDRDDQTLARLEAGVDEHVDVWTPTLHTSSRFELVAALFDIDDAIGDISTSISRSNRAGSTAFLEWLATGRFTRAAFLDDDHLLEPTGAVIRIAGATSIGFTPNGRAAHVRCYYDRLSIVEQMLVSHTAPSLG